MVPLRPLLSALQRHRLATGLIVLEIALACAVLGNALFLIGARLDLIRIDSGVDEAALGFVTLRGCDRCVDADVNGRALAALRALPGVHAAGVINTVPFAAPRANAGICRDRDCHDVAGVPHLYMAGPGAIAALGLRPASGRGFAAEDFQPLDGSQPAQSAVWISRAMATQLWPGESALGREFWSSDARLRVAGIVEGFVRPDPGRSENGAIGAGWSVIVPVRDDAQSGSYVFSADRRDLPRLMAAARSALTTAVPEAVLDQDQSRSLLELRQRYFQRDRTMAWLLLTVIAAMLLVTALGIVGLASFWVAQRSRQIGVRRALGATRRDILRYFQTENLLIVAAGSGLGLLLAYAGNALLMRWFELERLPALYLPAAIVALLALGQLAVLGPALRAAAVPPATATRSI